MPRNLRPITCELLHPWNTFTPPTLPLRRQPVLFQVLPIDRPQNRIENVRKTLHHRENRIRQVSAAVPAERPRTLGRAAEPFHRRTLGSGGSCLQNIHRGTPRAIVRVDLGESGIGRRGRAEGDGDHFRGDTDPCREDGACCGAAVVAVVGRDHGKVDRVVRSGEWVEGARGAWGNFDAVADRAAIAATVDSDGVLG